MYLPFAGDASDGAALGRGGCGKDWGRGRRYGRESHRGRFRGGGAKEADPVATGAEEGGSSASSSEVAPYAAHRRSIGARRSGF